MLRDGDVGLGFRVEGLGGLFLDPYTLMLNVSTKTFCRMAFGPNLPKPGRLGDAKVMRGCSFSRWPAPALFDLHLTSKRLDLVQGLGFRVPQ